MKRLVGVASIMLVACVGDEAPIVTDAGMDGSIADAPTGDAGQDASCGDTQNDPNNCGACGHACGTGSTCSSGYCSPVTLCNGGTGNPNNAFQVIVFNGAAYFRYGSEIASCNLGATNATASTFFKNTLPGFTITDLTSDTKYFYFVAHSTNYTNALYRSDGTQTNTSFVVQYPAGWVSSYVRTDDDPTTGKVFASLTTQVSMVLLDQATDAGVPTYTCVANATTLSSAAASGGKFFYADSGNKKVLAVTVTNDTCASPSTIAGALTSPGAVGAGGTTVAFADGNGNVYACDAALGCTPQVPPTPLATGQGGVMSIVVDSAAPANLYWVGSSGLVKCSSSSGTCNGKPTILVPNAQPTAGITVDASYVYYLQGGVLNRVAK